MESLLPERGLRSKSAAVVQVLRTHPRLASFGSTADIARRAGANVATVTRTAQALGFAGWPALQQELRGWYLSSLSAPEVIKEHHSVDSPAAASIRRDLDSLGIVQRRFIEHEINDVAEAIASARRTIVIADGSYAAVGMAFAHNARLAGYDVHAISVGDAELANAMARTTGDDVLVAISFWRLYQSTVLAAHEAREHGARVFVITDAASPALAKAADRVLLVPTEGVTFFPSLTAGMALAQAIVAQLAGIDEDRTEKSIEAAEAMWARFDLLRRRPHKASNAD
nr:MurR/RpiR family transcriptional regulator [Amycolatopsis sp. GM8]